MVLPLALNGHAEQTSHQRRYASDGDGLNVGKTIVPASGDHFAKLAATNPIAIRLSVRSGESEAMPHRLQGVAERLDSWRSQKNDQRT